MSENIKIKPVNHQTDGEIGGSIEGYILVPEDSYQVQYHTFELKQLGNYGDRLLMWFAITEGDHCGELIPYWCPIKILDINRGHWSVRKASKFYNVMQNLTGRHFGRRDRIKPSLLKNMELTAKVVTVVKDKHGKTYNLGNRYSKIDSLENLS